MSAPKHRAECPTSDDGYCRICEVQSVVTSKCAKSHRADVPVSTETGGAA